jgi:hypothetical protein
VTRGKEPKQFTTRYDQRTVSELVVGGHEVAVGNPVGQMAAIEVLPETKRPGILHGDGLVTGGDDSPPFGGGSKHGAIAQKKTSGRGAQHGAERFDKRENFGAILGGEYSCDP